MYDRETGMYRHTQKAYLVGLVIVVLAVPIGAVVATPAAEAGRILAFLVLLVLFVCAAIFSRMTVAIEGAELVWHFAFGWHRKSVLLADITGVEPTRTSLLDGWGIHLTSRGLLYNVSGAEAVLVKVRTGSHFLLGTDRPGELAQAIEGALRLRRAALSGERCDEQGELNRPDDSERLSV